MTDRLNLYKLFTNEYIYKESNNNIDYWVFNHYKIRELYIHSINKDNNIYTVCMINEDDNIIDSNIELSELVNDIKLIYVDDIDNINNIYDFIDGYFTINKELNNCFNIKLKPNVISS
jgi:hypothetical protein